MRCYRCHFYSATLLGPLLLLAVLSVRADIVVPVQPTAASKRLMVLIEEVREDFPQVQHISVLQLKEDFEGALLLDVRGRDEYEVSHIPGAIHVQSAEEIDAVARAHPQKALVFYCTVGVRSAIATRDFLARRAADETLGTASRGPAAVNFAGSIFAWANRGEVLENAAGPTQEVHPYSAWWGLRYLDDARPHQASRQMVKDRRSPK